METPTKHEQFRVIKCAVRKYTTLSVGTASVSGQQTVFDGASNHKRSSMGRVIAVPGRGVLSLWSFSAIPAGVSVYFLHFCKQYSSFVSLFLFCVPAYNLFACNSDVCFPPYVRRLLKATKKSR